MTHPLNESVIPRPCHLEGLADALERAHLGHVEFPGMADLQRGW